MKRSLLVRCLASVMFVAIVLPTIGAKKEQASCLSCFFRHRKKKKQAVEMVESVGTKEAIAKERGTANEYIQKIKNRLPYHIAQIKTDMFELGEGIASLPSLMNRLNPPVKVYLIKQYQDSFAEKKAKIIELGKQIAYLLDRDGSYKNFEKKVAEELSVIKKYIPDITIDPTHIYQFFGFNLLQARKETAEQIMVNIADAIKQNSWNYTEDQLGWLSRHIANILGNPIAKENYDIFTLGAHAVAQIKLSVANRAQLNDLLEQLQSGPESYFLQLGTAEDLFKKKLGQ